MTSDQLPLIGICNQCITPLHSGKPLSKANPLSLCCRRQHSARARVAVGTAVMKAGQTEPLGLEGKVGEQSAVDTTVLVSEQYYCSVKTRKGDEGPSGTTCEHIGTSRCHRRNLGRDGITAWQESRIRC